MDYPKFTVSNQKEESISIQGLNMSSYLVRLDTSFWCEKSFIISGPDHHLIGFVMHWTIYKYMFISGLWNHVFLVSNISLFMLMPFAYFFTEAEGFSGSRKVNN